MPIWHQNRCHCSHVQTAVLGLVQTRGMQHSHEQTCLQAGPEEHTCMISAQSGPIMCTPMTVSVFASTRIFMNPLPSLPEMVFFIGLQFTQSADATQHYHTHGHCHCVYGSRPGSAPSRCDASVFSVSLCWCSELGEDKPSSYVAISNICKYYRCT